MSSLSFFRFRRVLTSVVGFSRKTYAFDPAGIHMTFSFVDSVIFRNPPSTDPKDVTGSFVGEPSWHWKEDGKEVSLAGEKGKLGLGGEG